MQDCLGLILNYKNGIFINKRYYKTFYRNKEYLAKKLERNCEPVRQILIEQFFKNELKKIEPLPYEEKDMLYKYYWNLISSDFVGGQYTTHKSRQIFDILIKWTRFKYICNKCSTCNEYDCFPICRN